jgi:SAM-dependent methyltransferase
VDARQIREWFLAPRKSQLGRDRVMELYFTFHPRTAFLKNLPRGSSVVDIGAGDGSLSVFASWPEPKRTDLELHAYSIEKGKAFDQFKSYELSDWNASPPEFQGRKFDAVVCAHFIEHIADPLSFVDWAARKLNPGGRVYLEWPSPASLQLPSRAELEPLGVPLMISRFDDDCTHRALPDGDAISAACIARGFVIECRGIVRLPWLEDEMLAHYRTDADGFPRQAAFWSRTGWSQYLVLQLGD